ncbi:MAG TPA: hypothetical protein VFX97_13700 [Pyrinomonadaceae bacterium]|nr:hypothetical protein [Pyrinomonadaceae bacterium]
MKTTNSISKFCLILVLSFFSTLLCASTTFAQYTPEKGSVERKAITDALRVPVEKKLKQSVVFNIDHLKVQDDWAFMLGAPRKPGGGKLDYSKTSYAEAQRLGMFDDGISALLHKVRGRWTVVKYILGATDVPYIGWDEEYRAPAGIFPN